MHAIIITLAIVLPFVWYALWGRNYLKNKTWMQWYYCSAVGEWIELHVLRKSETVFWSRSKHLFAAILAALPYIGAIDVTPYLVVIPENHRWWVMLIPSAALTLDGIIGEIQRNNTTRPMDLVAVSNEELKKPKVQEAIAVAEVAKVEAVAVLKVAKAEGSAP